MVTVFLDDLIRDFSFIEATVLREGTSRTILNQKIVSIHIL